MKKVILSILSLGILGALNAQVVKDTIVTGANYKDVVFYELDGGNKTAMEAKSWHLAFRPMVGQYGASIRFNSLVGDLRLIPSIDSLTQDQELKDIDTSGWAAQPRLFDLDKEILTGAFNQSSSSEFIGATFDYSWGEYVMQTHTVVPRRVFGAQIGSGFYLFKFLLQATERIYHVTYYKLGDADEVTYTVDMSNATDKNYVYSNILDKSTLNAEPKMTEWDLLFGQYATFVTVPQGSMVYVVSGVLSNLDVEIAKIITSNPEGYVKDGSEEYSKDNNVIGWNSWKQSGQGGTTISDTTLFFVKAKNGAIWKVRFLDFISGTGTSELAGAYILEKEVLSGLGVAEQAVVISAIYPNPANDNAQLVVDVANDATIEVYDLTGMKIHETNLNAGFQTVTINTSEFTNGIYQVVVSSNGKQTTKKLVVQH